MTKPIPPFTRFVTTKVKVCHCCHRPNIQVGDSYYGNTKSGEGYLGYVQGPLCGPCASKLAPSEARKMNP